MPNAHKNVSLRATAERRLDKISPVIPAWNIDTMKILHELQVHQVELEMQGEELDRSLALSEAMRAKYYDLYNFAPVAYLTISPDGKIFDANIAAGVQFGITPESLVGRDLRALFTGAAMVDVAALLNRLEHAKGDVFAHSVMINERTVPRYVNIQARAYTDPVLQQPRVSIVLMDVTALKAATEDICSVISDFGKLA
jgi:PAS domain S-box-containing protein